MIKIIIKGANGEETGTGQLPESWDEVTVENYIGIQTIKNDSELLANLSGVPLDTIENTHSNLDHVFKVIAKYLTKKPEEFERIRGHKIEVEGVLVKFPKSIENTTFGQTSLIKQLLQDNADDLEKIVPDVFAIYLQPLVDGRFDRERVDHFKKVVLKMPIVEVRPHVLFFLNALKRLKTTLSIDFLM